MHGHQRFHGQKAHLYQGSGDIFQMVYSFLLQEEGLALEL